MPTPSPGAPTGDEISLLTWNLGYGGLGADSDFFQDLGEMRRAPSVASIDANFGGIASHLGREGGRTDILLLQEMAEPSWVNFGRDLLSRARAALPGHDGFYGADFRTAFLVPPPFRLSVGGATFTRLAGRTERQVLPGPREGYYGVASREYAVHVLRLEGPTPWTVLNVHLSAFDAAESGLREAQAGAVFDIAEAERAKGRCVVIGGDWNMRLTPTDFPQDTEERFRFWIRDLPEGLAPEGWTWALDPAVPTVRTLHEPYRPNITYTTIIDGFLIAPEVEILSVETTNLNFAHSDHQPVRLRVRAGSCD